MTIEPGSSVYSGQRQCSDFSDTTPTPQDLFFVYFAYGLYVPLFCVAIWSSCQAPTRGSRWMRTVSSIMFAVVTFALVVESFVAFGCHPTSPFLEHSPSANMLSSIISYLVGASTVFAAFLSDGTLAWRCYKLYGSRLWMKWVFSLSFPAMLGFGLLEAISYTNDVSLAPLYLALNSLLSILIIGRIIAMRKRTSFQNSRSLLGTTSRAVIESALTSWAAVFVAMMLDYASKNGDAATSGLKARVQSSLTAALPTIMGISQTLIIARFAMSRFVNSSDFTATIHILTADLGGDNDLSGNDRSSELL